MKKNTMNNNDDIIYTINMIFRRRNVTKQTNFICNYTQKNIIERNKEHKYKNRKQPQRTFIHFI